MMTALNKACFLLSATSRLSGKRLLLPSTPLLRTLSTRMASSSSGQNSSSDIPAAAAHWPSPAAFNALPHSSRSKVYCDFGDAGKMTWKPHEEPPKVCGHLLSW